MIETPTREETKPVMLEIPKPVTLEDVLPDARKLSAYDKLMLIQILAQDLMSEAPAYFFPSSDESFIEVNAQDPQSDQDSLSFSPNREYYIYTPYESYGAAEQLSQLLEHAK